MFVLFLSLILSLITNFFSLIALLNFFSHLQFHCYSFFIFLYKFHYNEWMDFNFNSRKRKRILIVFDLWYKINFKNKQVKYLLFKNYIESSFCYSLIWLAIVISGIGKCCIASNYILIFGKWFQICKLIYWLKTKNINL